MFKVSNEFVKGLTDKIADLEAKLAEKQKLLEDSVDVHEMEEKDIYKLRYELAGATETIEVLKPQLAEKEKEIKSKERTINALQNGLCVDLLNKEMLELRNQHQDKISFCIEQLEKVKWIVEDIQCACGDDYNISRDFLIEEIDSQIKQLKEMK